jgi:hypothetical protein
MEDYAAFCRQRAVACFHRRRRWPFLSPAWRHEVDDARSFIRYYRAEWQSCSAQERLDAVAKITRTVYALGPCVRMQKAITHPQRDKAGNEP